MRAIWYDKEVNAIVQQIENEIIEDGCQIVLDTAKKSMKPGTGNVWPSQLGGWHRASKPGIPPAPDTTVLRESISYITSSGKKGGGENTVEQPAYGINTGVTAGRIGTTEEMGIRHEMRYTWKGVERKWLRPALSMSKSKILKMFSKYKNKI